MIANGEVRPPPESGMPDIADDLAPEAERLSELLVSDRDQERNR
jgi:hypothetical protein